MEKISDIIFGMGHQIILIIYGYTFMLARILNACFKYYFFEEMYVHVCVKFIKGCGCIR